MKMMENISIMTEYRLYNYSKIDWISLPMKQTMETLAFWEASSLHKDKPSQKYPDASWFTILSYSFILYPNSFTQPPNHIQLRSPTQVLLKFPWASSSLDSPTNCPLFSPPLCLHEYTNVIRTLSKPKRESLMSYNFKLYVS